MASVNEFMCHMADVFSAFGPLEVRRMFAGHGLFREGLMFALVYDETLYLKFDVETARASSAAACRSSSTSASASSSAFPTTVPRVGAG